MRRFWLVLLSLGFIMAFSTAAMAVNVKFSGEFYAAGLYLDKVNISGGHEGNDYIAPQSTAFYFQRLRLKTDFVVAPGLKLVTRFDAMERAWGAPRSYPGVSSSPGSGMGSYYMSAYAGTDAEYENIAFDWAYIEYASPIGVFTVGYQPDGGWGTVFADNEVNGPSVGKVAWALNSGSVTGRIQAVKLLELSRTAKLPATWTDGDIDKYSADIKYAWKDGDAGLRGFYVRAATPRIPDWFLGNVYGVMPYAKAKIGPVTLQAELDYYWGTFKSETASASDMKIENIGFYLDAVADFKMFYAGGTFAYVSGDDPGTTDKLEGNYLTGGVDLNPCLILFNYDVITKWVGAWSSHSGPIGGPMTNAWFLQGRVGVRPIQALDIMAALSWAQADQLPAVGWAGKGYGYELDVVATYKITNNLSYMLGVGYLWPGDYFKADCFYQGDGPSIIKDNYMIINKLTLTF